MIWIGTVPKDSKKGPRQNHQIAKSTRLKTKVDFID